MTPASSMDSEPDLDAAIAELATALRRKRTPSRYHAREILIALGQRLLAGDETRAASASERIADVVRARSAEWERAVLEELDLACTEFVLSVDPRYLSHPRYDFAYTITARERLEARLVAADRLGIVPGEGLLERVVQADLALEPHLRRRDGPGKAEGPGRSRPG